MRYLLIFSIFISQSSFGQSFGSDIAKAAIERTSYKVHYDGSNFSIPYPNGDVPSNIGVCTDAIIRSYCNTFC
ncbi:DUF1287 domain-containing protein [Shewanella baltica]|nr:DUF1287 domain-containing protein [Shewanella baltica]